jgi:hypothetical protein
MRGGVGRGRALVGWIVRGEGRRDIGGAGAARWCGQETNGVD